MTEHNGRWWKTPSFSLEDIIKWGMVMGPLAFFWLTIWLDVKEIKKTIPVVLDRLSALEHPEKARR